MQNEMRTYSECVYEPAEVVEVRYIKKSGGATTTAPSLWCAAGELAGRWADMAKLNAAGFDVYAGANPRWGVGRRGDDAVTLARTLFADFDPGEGATLTAEACQERVRGAGLPSPTLWVSSGRGYHTYWRLAEPMTDLALWTACQKRLAAALRSDTAVVNPERIMRLPGFVNHKNGQHCRILSADPTRRHELTLIVSCLPPLPAETAQNGVIGHADADHATTCPYGHTALERELDTLRGVSEGGRNSRLNQAAFALGQLIAGGCLSWDAVRCQLVEVAGSIGLGGGEAVATVDSGLKAGQKEPRQCRQLCELWNFEAKELDGGKTVSIGLAATEIAGRLTAHTHGWPKRVGPMLFVRQGDAPLYLEKVPALLAWIGAQYPGKANAVRWADGPDKVSQAQFMAHLQQTAENFAAVEAMPHEPPMAGFYYCLPEIKGGDGRALDALLARFNPATDIDASLIKAFFLSLFWGGAAGQRPAWLFTGSDGDTEAGRGVGKTTLARMAARLCGGLVSLAPQDSIEAFKTRLLSPEARGKRVVLVDNVKSLKFSSAELEGLLTADVISGRQLYSGEGRLPNVKTFIVTVNGARLSKDLAQRTITVKLARPAYDGDWEGDTAKLIDDRRWDVIGDILAVLRRRGPSLPRHSRWGLWEAGVLSQVDNAAACQEVIAERQAECDEDAAEAELVRDEIHVRLNGLGISPDSGLVFFPSKALANIVSTATEEAVSMRKLPSYLAKLGIAEFRKTDKNTARGYLWRGMNSRPDQVAVAYRGL